MKLRTILFTLWLVLLITGVSAQTDSGSDSSNRNSDAPVRTKPLFELAYTVLGGVDQKSVDLQENFQVILIGTIDSDGLLNERESSWSETLGNPQMIEIGKLAIVKVGKSGWLKYLHDPGNNKVLIVLGQNDGQMYAEIMTKAKSVNSARATASGLSGLVRAAVFASKNGIRHLSEDEMILLQSVTVVSNNELVTVRANIEKCQAQALIERNLEKLRQRKRDRETPKVATPSKAIVLPSSKPCKGADKPINRKPLDDLAQRVLDQLEPESSESKERRMAEYRRKLFGPFYSLAEHMISVRDSGKADLTAPFEVRMVGFVNRGGLLDLEKTAFLTETGDTEMVKIGKKAITILGTSGWLKGMFRFHGGKVEASILQDRERLRIRGAMDFPDEGAAQRVAYWFQNIYRAKLTQDWQERFQIGPDETRIVKAATISTEGRYAVITYDFAKSEAHEILERWFQQYQTDKSFDLAEVGQLQSFLSRATATANVVE